LLAMQMYRLYAFSYYAAAHHAFLSSSF
jgi:hypothetical protein